MYLVEKVHNKANEISDKHPEYEKGTCLWFALQSISSKMAYQLEQKELNPIKMVPVSLEDNEGNRNDFFPDFDWELFRMEMSEADKQKYLEQNRKKYKENKPHSSYSKVKSYSTGKPYNAR